MSSVDWKKIHGNAAGLISHATRHDGREVEYSNKDIDPSKSKDNYLIGAMRSSTRSIEYFFTSRLKELDTIHKPKRIRKDRVTRMGFCVTAPEGLTPPQERLFFKIAYSELAETCGGRKNLTAGFVHVDEVHEYYDKIKDKKVLSRSHMHVFGLPWTEEYGVNAKHFMTRERMVDLNRRIEERCMKELHVHFLTGEKEHVGRDVTDLKRESLAQEVERAEKRLLELSEQERGLQKAIDQEKAQKRVLEARTAELRAELNELASEVNKSPQKALKRAYRFMDRYAYDDDRSMLDKFQEVEARRASRELER